MLTRVPFSPIHMEFCEFAPEYVDAAARENPEMLAHSKEAWTFLDADGRVVAIVGAMQTHDRVAFVWTFASCHAGRHLLGLTRFVKDWLPTLGCIRLEATVLKDFRLAHRLMRLIGFKRETTRPMKRWDGVSDFHLYAMIAR